MQMMIAEAGSNHLPGEIIYLGICGDIIIRQDILYQPISYQD